MADCRVPVYECFQQYVSLLSHPMMQHLYWRLFCRLMRCGSNSILCRQAASLVDVARIACVGCNMRLLMHISATHLDPQKTRQACRQSLHRWWLNPYIQACYQPCARNDYALQCRSSRTASITLIHASKSVSHLHSLKHRHFTCIAVASRVESRRDDPMMA